ncbi:MAG: SpoIIE family protein phosphatase [Marinilabiliaceae bacterium]|jgi:serine phosphatase RsbU (regulator of sigma subunit)|nr:SpoIIE family protein phosphatase [Marinilabiliaceae bacterium]
MGYTLEQIIRMTEGRNTFDTIEFMQAMEDHLSSLRYARMIQQALIPDTSFLQGILKDHFVIYLPKDIVSGDFYYAYQNAGYTIIATGDCTGHGVPGALLSILGISFLNEILQVKTVPRANRILNRMREKVMVALDQKGKDYEKKDSIDIALCVYEPFRGVLQYAGANRPLMLVRDGVLKEYRPDKMPIGVAPLEEVSFTNHRIEVKEGDLVYLFSDGYPDQFGWETNKKFKINRFRELLVSVSGLSMTKQKDHIENTFLEWMGKSMQVDDVTVLGFEI